jgi:hypothetical protein
MIKLTYQQTRVELARGARQYERAEIITRLHLLGYNRPIPPTATLVSLSFRLAWLLLPAALECEAVDSDLSADLSVARQRL